MRCTDGVYGISKQDVINSVLVLDVIIQDVENGKLPKYFDIWHIKHTNEYLADYVNNYYDLLNPTK